MNEENNAVNTQETKPEEGTQKDIIIEDNMIPEKSPGRFVGRYRV